MALEALKGELTLAELAAKHGVHQTMIADWKRQAIEGMAASFPGKPEAASAASLAEVDRLHAKIGQLVVELDFLPKGSIDEAGWAACDDRAVASAAFDGTAMRAGGAQPLWRVVCQPRGGSAGDLASANDRRQVEEADRPIGHRGGCS